MIDKIKRDREAGTPGPWLQSHRKRESGMYSTEVYPATDTDNTIASVHWHSIKNATGFTTDRDALARRIARVPDMEAALLVADELAKACESAFDGIDATGPQEFYLALAAWNAATKGDQHD